MTISRDPVFLTELFTEVNPYLTRVGQANGFFGDELHELLHQTWERFFINLEKFEGRSQIKTYICGILLNKIREYRRQQKRVVYEENSEIFLNEAFTEKGWWINPPPAPDRISELKQSSQFIEECLKGLTEQQKTAFVMKEVDEENSEDICSSMEISISNLRVLLFRAKDKLRKCLEGKVSVA